MSHLKIIKCENCGCDTKIFHRQRLKAKHNFCSKKCAGEWTNKQNLNCTCPICGKKFHVKQSRLAKMKLLACCSRECNKKYRSLYMTGKGNHQYGLKGNKNSSFKNKPLPKKNGSQCDIWVYCPDNPYANKSGRVRLHRRIVEIYAEHFERKFFDEVNGKLYLKKHLYVHHIDGNHNNNEFTNLQSVTRAEHRRLHNLMKAPTRDILTGRFIKTKGSDKMQIKFKRTHPDAKTPYHGTKSAAGYDLYAVSVEELPHNVIKYHTGIAVEIPEGYVGLIFPRSSIIKQGLSMSNAVGVIDSDFRNEMSAVFYKNSDSEVYKPGDRVCQLVIMPIPAIEFIEVDELSETERGANGFGSTGVR